MESGKSKITLEHLTKLSAVNKISFLECIKLVNQTDEKTVNVTEEKPDISRSEPFDGVHLSFELVSQ